MTLTEMTIADIQRALADGELSARAIARRTLDDMAQLSPDEWPDLRVDLAPSVQQMLCRFWWERGLIGIPPCHEKLKEGFRKPA